MQVDQITGCWEFNQKGYASVKVDGKSIFAARLSYKEFVGPIPRGHIINRKCGNKKCINPEHLYTAPYCKYVGDYCVNGHKLTEHNTYIDPDGKRWCKKCRKEHTRRSRTLKPLREGKQTNVR